jgi:putative tryptophan/tyrosine transport system substrate-binding protein
MQRQIGLLIIFVTILASVHLAEAQQAKKFPTIGYLLSAFPPSPSAPSNYNVDGFLQGLQELGYVEGKNLAIEYRWAAGKSDQRLFELAAELVSLKVDVIVARTTQATLAAKRATTTIPIVMVGPGDPVGTGLVASLARPGGNITGLSLITTELTGKRLELLKEAFPRVSRVAVLWNSADSAMTLRVKEAETVSPVLGMTIQRVGVQEPNDFEKAFSAMSNKAADALLVVMDPFTSFHQRRILDFAVKNQLPAMYERTDLVDAGGLMSYGPALSEIFRRAAHYVDRILKGTKPADLPVEQPMKFELVINLKTAKQIGVTIPPNVLARADKVIR